MNNVKKSVNFNWNRSDPTHNYPGRNSGNREDHRHTKCLASLKYKQGQSLQLPVNNQNTGTDLKRITSTTTNKPALNYYSTNTNRLHPNQQQISKQTKMTTELMLKNMQGSGVWQC